MTIGSEGQVINPAGVRLADGLMGLIPPLQGKQGELLIRQLSGKGFTSGLRKNLFSFMVAAVTVPAVANNLVSVFSIWNPPGSGYHAELVDTDVSNVSATEVVDVMGWYFSSGSQALASTFTTKSVALTNNHVARVGDTVSNNIIPYTALTHSGTPVRCDIIANFGATATPVASVISKPYDGRIIVPPGTVISIAMSTAAGTASGCDLSARWVEWPFA